jgi:TRAP-type transport system periplasmic protein
MTTSRRRFAGRIAATAIVAQIGLSKPARARVRIRHSDALSPSNLSRIAMHGFWQEVSRRTNGQIVADFVQHRPGDERPVLSQIALGGVDSIVTGYTGLPEFDVLYAAHLFRNVEHGLLAINGPLRARLNAAMEQRYRCVLLGVASAGSLGIQVLEPAAAWSALRGRRIRTAPLDAVMASVRGLQAEPVVMPFEATHGALRDGLVDGLVYANTLMIARRYHEVLRYWVQGDFGLGFDKVIIARRVWDRLGARDQALLTNLFAEWAPAHWHAPIREQLQLDYGRWTSIHGEGSVIALDQDAARRILAPVAERLVATVFGPGAYRQIQDQQS